MQRILLISNRYIYPSVVVIGSFTNRNISLSLFNTSFPVWQTEYRNRILYSILVFVTSFLPISIAEALLKKEGNELLGRKKPSWGIVKFDFFNLYFRSPGMALLKTNEATFNFKKWFSGKFRMKSKGTWKFFQINIPNVLKESSRLLLLSLT